MKINRPRKYLVTILLTALTACVWTPARAQTNGAPQTFFTTVTGYFGGFNTNLASTFAADRVNIWAGADTVNNQNLAASFGVEYQLGYNFSLESVTRNATVAGVIVSEQGGLGYNLTYIDTRLTG